MILQATLLAQNKICGFGPLGLCTTPASGAPSLFEDALSKTVGFLTVCAVLWFAFQFILAAYKWISAGGDSKAVESARSHITQAITGLVLVFVTLTVISVVADLLGIDHILDIQKFIKELTPKP